MKGTMGWSRRSDRSKQYASTALAAGSSSLGFTASTYQSASSFHTNSKQRLAASSSRNCSSDAVASRITACARERIQRSARVSERRSTASIAGTLLEIGRASCRERVWVWGVAGAGESNWLEEEADEARRMW